MIPIDDQKILYLLHLADSALPIGSLAHSFGIETLVAEGILDVEQLESFLQTYLDEASSLDSTACRLVHRLLPFDDVPTFERQWLALNERLSALKMARESRAATAMLGRRLLQLARDLGASSVIDTAISAARSANVETHYCAAFGLVTASLGIAEDTATLAYLRQLVGNIVSCCQRLLPLGQSRASKMLWQLYPSIIAAADRSKSGELKLEHLAQFTPTLDLGSMRHTRLSTRLFIS